jgi:hypothetical protein
MISSLSSLGQLSKRALAFAAVTATMDTGQWVAVGWVGESGTGPGGIIVYSTDGNVWSPAARSVNGNVSGITLGRGAAYGKDGTGKGLWVTVGHSGIIAKSADGNVWTPAYTSVAGNVGGILYLGLGVAYGKDGTGKGLWVAVGSGGVIAKSTDGNIWTPAFTSTYGNVGGLTDGKCVAYGTDGTGAGLWVAVGSGGIIAKSTDGNVWTPAFTSTYGNVGGLTSIQDVAYGKDGAGVGLWVAVGGGGIIAKSTDGNIWTPAFTSTYGNVGGLLGGSGVAYGKDGNGAGLWVAVGSGGAIAKSSDGNIWTSVAGTYGDAGGISVGLGVRYGNGLWVATGYGGFIAKSTDGNVWTPAYNVGGINPGYAVAWRPPVELGQYVAVGNGTIIANSTDGNVWTPAYTSVAGNVGGITTQGQGLAYGRDGIGNRIWVATGYGSIIAKSTDGNIWSPAYTSTYGNVGGITSSGRGVAYGKDDLGFGLWVAVGDGGLIAKSTDGNVWTPAYKAGGLTNTGYGVAYGKDASGFGLWVAVGDSGIDERLILKSTDGNVWTDTAKVSGVYGRGGIPYTAYGIAYGKDGTGKGLWVACGNAGTIIAKSSDGHVWTPAYTSVAGNVGGITTNAYSVAYGKDGTGKGLWVAVGGGGIIAKSSDGNIWTPAYTSTYGNVGGISTLGLNVTYKSDEYGFGLWVAVGLGKSIAKSTDGNIWTPAGNVGGLTSAARSVAWRPPPTPVTQNQWVVVGSGELIANSTDGNIWTPAAKSADGSKGGIISSSFGVAYGKDGAGKGLWVAVGSGGVIAKSTDGIVWTPAGNVGGLSDFGAGVAYGKDNTGKGLWIAVGNQGNDGGVIVKSTDGNTWTSTGSMTNTSGIISVAGLTSVARGVAYGKDALGKGLWVAVGGTGIIAKSSDGNIWTPAGNVGGMIETGRGVAYGKDETGKGLWIAVGQGSLITKSTDGNIWTPVAGLTYNVGGITSYAYGVAYGRDGTGAGLWVAVGGGGIIAKSSDGNVWTPAFTSVAGNVGGITTEGYGVAYGKDALGKGIWVAVGLGGRIATSKDGNIWSPAATLGGITYSGSAVAFNNDII